MRDFKPNNALCHKCHKLNQLNFIQFKSTVITMITFNSCSYQFIMMEIDGSKPPITFTKPVKNNEKIIIYCNQLIKKWCKFYVFCTESCTVKI